MRAEILAHADPERYERARQAISDHHMRVLDLHANDQAIWGQVESKKVKVYKRKPSQITRNVYHVRLTDWENACTCEDWEYRGVGAAHATNGRITACKHMLALAAWHEARQRQAA